MPTRKLIDLPQLSWPGLTRTFAGAPHGGRTAAIKELLARGRALTGWPAFADHDREGERES
jgi:hypothetical protein